MAYIFKVPPLTSLVVLLLIILWNYIKTNRITISKVKGRNVENEENIIIIFSIFFLRITLSPLFIEVKRWEDKYLGWHLSPKKYVSDDTCHLWDKHQVICDTFDWIRNYIYILNIKGWLYVGGIVVLLSNKRIASWFDTIENPSKSR